MPLTIAVTGLNRGENPQPGPGIIRSLQRRYSDLTIIGLIYDVLESGVYADDCADFIYHLPYPKAGHAALLARFDYLLTKHSIDIFFPTLDSEIRGLLRIENALADRGIKMLMPTRQSYEACCKSELAKLAERCGCQSPLTYSVVEVSGLRKAAHRIGYPLMVKGPFYGAYKVHTEGDMVERYHQIIAEWGGPVLLQRCVYGSEYDVIAVGDGQGGVGGWCTIRKTILSEKGKGFGGITIHDDKLDAIAFDIIRELKWRGPLELEFLKDDATNTYYLIEINPRFPAWVDFPSSIDRNLPALVVETLLHGTMDRLPPCEAGVFYVRHSVELTGRIDQLGQLSTSGELVCRGRGSRLPKEELAAVVG
ncbi:MAG: hypothetical protein GX621_16360 [Pirellulaceae bacterium]|nr:hypothetical protein [Pirellulaceae bacterium]